MSNRLLIDSTTGSRLLLGAGIFDGFLLLGVQQMTEQISGAAVSVTMTATLQNSIDGNTVIASAAQGYQYAPTQPTNGTGANQGDRIWSDAGRTLASGADESLDVYDLGSVDIGAGVGKTALGQAFALAKVVGLLVVNRSATGGGSLTIGGNGTGAAWSSLFNGSDSATLGPIGPGGVAFVYSPDAAGIPVTDASDHLLKFAASGGDVTYDVAILGRSA